MPAAGRVVHSPDSGGSTAVPRGTGKTDGLPRTATGCTNTERDLSSAGSERCLRGLLWVPVCILSWNKATFLSQHRGGTGAVPAAPFPCGQGLRSGFPVLLCSLAAFSPPWDCCPPGCAQFLWGHNAFTSTLCYSRLRGWLSVP